MDLPPPLETPPPTGSGGQPPEPTYDPVAAKAQARALTAQANHGFVAPILKLIGRHQRAARLSLGAVALAGLGAAGATMLALDQPVLAYTACAPALAVMAWTFGVFVTARWDARTREHAEHGRWRAYDHDLGSEREKAEEQFRTLDKATAVLGLQDYSARTLALYRLNRSLNVEHSELELEMGRFFGFMRVVVIAAAAIGACGWVGALNAAHGVAGASFAGVAVLLAAAIAALATLHWGRKHVNDLVDFLAPPDDDPDALVSIIAWLFVLLGQVTAQNNYLRRD